MQNLILNIAIKNRKHSNLKKFKNFNNLKRKYYHHVFLTK